MIFLRMLSLSSRSSCSVACSGLACAPREVTTIPRRRANTTSIARAMRTTTESVLSSGFEEKSKSFVDEAEDYFSFQITLKEQM